MLQNNNLINHLKRQINQFNGHKLMYQCMEKQIKSKTATITAELQVNYIIKIF